MTPTKEETKNTIADGKKKLKKVKKKNLMWYQGEVADGDTDKMKYQVWLTKQELVLNPSISCRQLAIKLQVAKDTANGYLKKARTMIVKDRKKQLENLKVNTVEEELVKMEDEVLAMTIKLQEIIDSSWRARDKISAIRVLFNAKERVFNLKFDAGLFKRSLGEMKLVDVHNLVKSIYDARRDNNEKRDEL